MSCFNSWFKQKIQEIAYKNHVCFSASVPNSLSQNREISIMLMSGQELSKKYSQNVYPTKSKSFWRRSTYHRAFSSSLHWSHNLLLLVLYIPLPLILHFSSPVEEALRNSGMYMYIWRRGKYIPFIPPIQIAVRLQEHGYETSSRRKWWSWAIVRFELPWS